MLICEDHPRGFGSADARHEDLRSSREDAHPRPPAETGDPREREGGGSCNIGEGLVEIPVDHAKGRRVTVDEASAASEKKQKLQVDGPALEDGVGAGGVGGNAAGVDGIGDDTGDGEVELQPDGTARSDGTGSGDVELQTGGAELVRGMGSGEVDRKAAGVNGAGDRVGAGEVELKPDGAARLDGIGTGEVDLQTGGAEILHSIGTSEVDGQAAGANSAGDGMGAVAGELQPDGTARLDGIGTGKVDGKAAVVDGAGAGGFPIVDFEPKRILAKAMAEAAARAVRDAVEINRKTDVARARRAEKSRRRAEKKQKRERRASRDAKRREKLQQHRERREKRKGERSRRPVEGTEGPVRVEREAVAERGRGVSAHGDVQGCVHAAAAVRTETLLDEVNGRRVTADEAGATGAEKQKPQTDGRALSGGTGAGEVEELRRGGIALLDGVGAGRRDHKAAVMDDSDSGAGVYPLVDATQEKLRAKAIVEMAKRAARDAVKDNTKADLARARRAEKALRWAKRQARVERKASRDSRRDAKRLKKLKDRESRARSQAGAAGAKGASEESRSVGVAGGRQEREGL